MGTVPLAPAGFVLVHDRKKPGDYRVIARKDFDPTVDVLFEQPLPATSSDHSAQEPLGTPAAPVGEAAQAEGAASTAGHKPAKTPKPAPKAKAPTTGGGRNKKKPDTF